MKREIIRDTHKLSYEIVEGALKHLQGQVLTVLEATVPAGEQQKATKSLIKGFFNEKLTHFFSMYGDTSKQETPHYS
jgi:hypothetical protein